MKVLDEIFGRPTFWVFDVQKQIWNSKNFFGRPRKRLKNLFGRQKKLDVQNLLFFGRPKQNLGTSNFLVSTSKKTIGRPKKQLDVQSFLDVQENV